MSTTPTPTPANTPANQANLQPAANPNIRAPKVMLLGGPAGGKTTSLLSLAAKGISVRIVATEYPDVLLDLPCADGKQTVRGVTYETWGGVHWKYTEPGKTDWATLTSNAEKINTLSNDALQKLPGINKEKYRQWFDMLKSCSNFTCERCGKQFGDATNWTVNEALVMDSLSGLSIMARDLTVGAKPVITQPDWGVMMQNLEAFLNACTTGTKCWFVLTAHLERELDESTSSTKLMASTLGRKLAPKLPRFFTDVIYCRREGTSWYWDTAAIDVDSKTRNLPINGKLNPDFGQIVDTWRAKQKVSFSTEGG